MNTPITRVGGQGLTPLQTKVDTAGKQQDAAFGDVLKQMVEDVNSMQVAADEMQVQLATGEISDVHDVMIAVEEANVAMELMLEIRNKIIEAYQEVMRMPV